MRTCLCVTGGARGVEWHGRHRRGEGCPVGRGALGGDRPAGGRLPALPRVLVGDPGAGRMRPARHPLRTGPNGPQLVGLDGRQSQAGGQSAGHPRAGHRPGGQSNLGPIKRTVVLHRLMIMVLLEKLSSVSKER